MISKPLIMVVIITYYLLAYQQLNPDKPRNFFLFALIAAWIGDCLLLFEGHFVSGLASFLIMQTLYTICFWKDRNPDRKAIIFGIGLLVLIISMLLVLWNHLGGMKVPVLVYMSAISVMSYMAYLRKKGKGYLWILLGTILFVISDSVLAIHQFRDDISLGSLTVMSTYIMAQSSIVHGYTLDHSQE